MDCAPLQLMDLTSLKAVMADLREEILPSRFEKAQQLDSSTLQIGLRTLKGLSWLEISWSADAARIVEIPSPIRKGGESTLAKQFQHGLKQMTLIKLNQKGFDRIVEFKWALRPGKNIHRTLVVELMGRHSNILLLDEKQKIITLGRQVRNNQSRIRPLSTGDLYVPPPPLLGVEPRRSESMERWKQRLCLIPTTLKKSLQQSYQGISPSLILQIAHDEEKIAKSLINLQVMSISNHEWIRLYERWSIWLQRIEESRLILDFDGPTPFRVWNTKENKNFIQRGLSLALGRYYRDHLDNMKLSKIKRELENRIIHFRKAEENIIFSQQLLLKNTSKSNELQKKADNLLCSPFPSKDLVNQAQKLYRQVKKLRRSIPIIKDRILFHQQRIEIIQGSEAFAEEIINDNSEDNSIKFQRLYELQNELDELLSPRKKRKKNIHQKTMQPTNPLEIKSPSGLIIQIGRNHRQNDLISMRQSNRGDKWFHAQECPGSHVILKASTGLAEEEDFQMAADLAAFFSRGRGNRNVPVIVTSTDQLQRIPGAGPGVLRHRNSTVYWGDPLRASKVLSQSNQSGS